MKKGQLSEHFYRSEFECPCGCGFDVVDAELIFTLEYLRLIFGGRPITITSGCRCKKHNHEVGGSENSQHLYGKAADFTVNGISPNIVADAAEDIFKGKYGIGRYSVWTHIDMRPEQARWSN